jgi:carbamoyltransferase
MQILGIHSSFVATAHDSSAALVVTGKLVSANEEERFNRKKTSIGYPAKYSIRECLSLDSIDFNSIDLVVSDGTTYPSMKSKLSRYLLSEFGIKPEIELFQQSDCHLWGSFFHSGYDEALVFDIEGVGDQVSTKVSILRRSSKPFEPLQSDLYIEDKYNSIGIFYTLVTQFLGFEAIEGEYKVMGMAAYGNPKFDLSDLLYFDSINGQVIAKVNLISDELLQTTVAESTFNEGYLSRLFKTSPRRPNDEILQIHFDIAASLQLQFEQTYLGLVSYWTKKTGIKKVCMSGGCALNALANMRLLDLGLEGIFIMPASSDRGVSIGAAVLASFLNGEKVQPPSDVYLGSQYSAEQIRSELDSNQIMYEVCEDRNRRIAEDLALGKIVGNFIGQSEFGPRALGARSILANPRIPGMKDLLNAKIKFREKYRPFAPAVLEGSTTLPFSSVANLEYMTITTKISESEWWKFPEAIHFDGSSRVQLVKQNNIILSNLLKEVESLSGHASVINTSFNLKGEPIVNSPRDALRTFYGCGLDVLYLEDFRIVKQSK